MTIQQKEQLELPFPVEEIEWRVAATNKEKTKGIAVAYVNSRAIQARLDSIFGCENWQNVFDVTHGATDESTAYVCKIGIYSPERKEWIFKSDGSGPTDFEPVKGGLSGALKRAASVWGIGRYLYSLDTKWVEIEQQGKNYIIKSSELQTLKTDYNRAMHERKMQSKKGKSAEKTEMPKNPKPQSTADKPSSNNTSFRVIKCDVTTNSRGKQALLSLQTKKGEVVSGYYKGDPQLTSGQIISRVELEEKDDPRIGKYNIIRSFEKAA